MVQPGWPTSHRLTTVTYGLNCALFLALRTIQQLIKDEGQRFPKAIAPLTKGMSTYSEEQIPLPRQRRLLVS